MLLLFYFLFVHKRTTHWDHLSNIEIAPLIFIAVKGILKIINKEDYIEICISMDVSIYVHLVISEIT